MAILHIVTTDGDELAFPLTKAKLSIGRESGNDIVVPDASMSGRHAEIEETADGYLLTDLGSTNGTQINGQLIESALLSDGDSLVLGHASGVFSTETASAGSAEAPPPPARSVAAPASRSKSPGGFSNTSPFSKMEKAKDPKGQAILAVGFLGVLACVVAIALSLVMLTS